MANAHTPVFSKRGSSGMEIDAQPRPELVYTIDPEKTGWTVCCEDQRYGPFPTLREAVGGALAEAREAIRLGFCSTIVERSTDGQCHCCWLPGLGDDVFGLPS